MSILKSEITRITNVFVSDYDIKKTFCPKLEDLNFYGFEEIINKGKILVLNMNISEYRNLSKIICAIKHTIPQNKNELTINIIQPPN